jgi:antirestriction protein ArdC
MNGHENLFDRVTNKIIADLEAGVPPWRKPWSVGNLAPLLRPRRHNGEFYNGMNILLLWDAADTNGFQNPVWMTFKQALEYKAHVRKGEKGSLVVYADKLAKTETDKTTGEEVERIIPFMKGYTVFNVEQIEDLPDRFYTRPEPPDRTIEAKAQRIERLESFFKATGAVIRNGGDRAFYAPSRDIIQMPPLEAFEDSESYYATLGHETVHWTSHETRLNRTFGKASWGNESYAKEELVAEIDSAFLCADLAITPEVRPDHASYLAFWLEALKNDKRLIFSAAAYASKAVEYLKGERMEIHLNNKQKRFCTYILQQKEPLPC